MKRLPLALLAALAGSIAAPATAQQTQRWKLNDQGGVCGAGTNKTLQPQLASASFGMMAERRDRFQILLAGQILQEAPDPKAGALVFAGRTVPVAEIQFVRQPQGRLLDDAFQMILHMEVDALKDMAESPSFAITIDGADYVAYRLADRGAAVVWLARCMMALPG